MLQRLKPEATLLIERAVGKQVAGQLLDRELIERHVAIEGVDHPIAKRPHLAIIVDMNAVGVGIAGGIEPIATPMFALARRGQQPIDIFFIGVGRFVVRGILRLARASGGRPVRSRHTRRASVRRIGFGRRLQAVLLELRQNEAVDRIADPSGVLHRRQCRAAWAR